MRGWWRTALAIRHPFLCTRMRMTLQVTALFLLAGCDGRVGLGGQWTGVSATGARLNVTLAETPQGAVSGSGVLFNGVNSVPVNIVGAHAHPSLSMTIDFPRINFQPISFQGTLNTAFSSVKGVLNGSGFNRDTLVLVRNDPVAGRVTGP